MLAVRSDEARSLSCIKKGLIVLVAAMAAVAVVGQISPRSTMHDARGMAQIWTVTVYPRSPGTGTVARRAVRFMHRAGDALRTDIGGLGGAEGVEGAAGAAGAGQWS